MEYKERLRVYYDREIRTKHMKRVSGLLGSTPPLNTYIPSLHTYRWADRQTVRQTTHETNRHRARETDRQKDRKSENANT